MRVTYKDIQDYFDTYVKPIAPLLKLNTVNDGYTIALLTSEGASTTKKTLVFQDTARETMKWMIGFVNSYNYFRSEL